MDSANPVHKDILKKEELESSELNCDAWLLPEVYSKHVVHCKETSEVKKRSADETLSEPASSDTGMEENQSEQAVTDNGSEHADLKESAGPGQASLLEKIGSNFSPAVDLVPEQLSEFNEPLTLKRLQQKVNSIQREAWTTAHEQGLKSGYEDGRANAQNELQTLTQQIEQLTGQLNNLLNEQQETLQSALLSMIIQIVERMTKITIEQSPDILNKLLHEALELYPQHAEKPAISLCQQDYELMNKNGLLSQNCLWSVDEAVTPGGFLVKGKYAEIDQRYETRLQQIIDQYFSQ